MAADKLFAAEEISLQFDVQGIHLDVDLVSSSPVSEPHCLCWF